MQNELCERLGIDEHIVDKPYAVRRTHSYAGVERTQDVAFDPVGQTVGMIRAVQSSRDVIQEMLTELVGSADRPNDALGDGEGEGRG